MPRVNVSNGIRPEIRALGVLKLGVPVTPAEIDAHVGTGQYAAKYVSFLNTRYGFSISAQKDGRKVVSYTVDAEPSNAEDLRNTQPKVKAPPAPKEPKAKAAKKAFVKKAASAKAPAKKAAAKKGGSAANLAKLKEIGAKRNKPVDEVEQTFGTTGEVGSAVDAGWDSIDGLDLSKLI